MIDKLTYYMRLCWYSMPFNNRYNTMIDYETDGCITIATYDKVTGTTSYNIEYTK